MNRFHILEFPNKMSYVDWLSNLPQFRDKEGDDAAFHLIKFHFHIHKLGIKFLEDCLMKIFMATLEGRARSWYEELPSASLYSLDDFYKVLCKNYKGSYPTLVLVEYFCGNFKNLFQHMGIDIDDQDLIDNDIREALFEISYPQEELVEASSHDNQNNFQQALVSHLVVDEIDQDSDVPNNISLPEFDKDINKHSHVPIFVGDEGMQQALVTNCTILGLPTDDFREVFDSSRYDEHNDDYSVDFLDLLAEDSS